MYKYTNNEAKNGYLMGVIVAINVYFLSFSILT